MASLFSDTSKFLTYQKKNEKIIKGVWTLSNPIKPRVVSVDEVNDPPRAFPSGNFQN